MHLGVLASGSGTLLDAILDDGIAVAVVVVDRTCAATDVADRHGVPWVHVVRDSFGKDFDRDGYTEQVVKVLQSHGVDLIVSAGFGTVIPRIVDAYPGRMLNSHPALLPSFKGWHAVRDALEYGVKVTGCTIHMATEETDVGPILAQEAVAVLPDDTVETLHERIKVVERRLYPDVIRRFERGELP